MTTRSRSLAIKVDVKNINKAVKFRCKALQCLHGSADRDYAKRLTTEKESNVDISNSKHGAWAFFK